MIRYNTPTQDSYVYSLRISDMAPPLPCQVIFCKRKSIAVQVQVGGQIVVRAPYTMTVVQVASFLECKREWIEANHKKIMERAPHHIPLSLEEAATAASLDKKLQKEARKHIPLRVAYFCQYTGGIYTSVSIRNQKTRWGSCSSRGTLSFNYRLMLAPAEVLDYVIVHELCHLTHMNHSKDFWSMVERIMPDFRFSKKWLKEHGQELTPEIYVRNQRLAEKQ